MHVDHRVDFHKTGAWSATFSIEFFIPNFTKIQWTIQLRIPGHRTDGRTWSLCKAFFLGSSAKFQNATISFIMPVRLSVHPSVRYNLAPTGRILINFDNWVFLKICQKKIQVSLKSDMNNRDFTWRPIHIVDHISLSSSWEWETFQKKVAEKIKKLCSVTFKKNHAIYEIMLKNTIEPDRPQMTTWCMCTVCWIPKATNTNS